MTICRFALVLPFLLSATVPARAQAPARPEIAKAIEAVYPSLVRISVVTLDHSGGREVKHEASGSGTIVSADGFVVTNHHVAGRATRIVCTLFDKQEIHADLVGTDPLSDISVLKLRPASPRAFPFARFGDSTTLARGDTVLAMGSPLALSQSVTLGIISNPEMVMPGTMRGGFSLDGEDVGTIVRWIGHDAAIYPGNSGGPLVNLAGDIVGVNEISFGLAGAIPASLARPVVESLMKEGRVRRSWTGMQLQPTLHGDAHRGALVSWVADGSPAAKAGIESGDVLAAVNGAPVEVKFPEQLPTINLQLATLPIGKPVRLDIARAKGSVTVSVVPSERAPAEGTPTEFREWGIVGTDITPAVALEMARSSTDGVLVMELRSGGAASQARPPLESDDVIVALEGKPVRSIADLRRATLDLLGDKPQVSALVGFERGDEHGLTILDVARPSVADPVAEAAKASLPVDVQVLTPALAERLKLPGRTGVRVTRVRSAQLPLRVGDVLLALDGTPIRATTPADEGVFAAMLRQYRIGASVALTVFRDGAELPVTVALTAAPRLAREMRRYDATELGFQVRELASEDTDDPTLRGVTRGVVVAEIESGGWAALARLRTGDLILQVDGAPVATIDDLKAAIGKAVAARAPTIVLKVRRGVRTSFVELEPVWK